MRIYFLLCFLLVVPATTLSAAVEGFESGNIVPKEWKSEPANNLSIITDVKHGGTKSLLWKWEWWTDLPDTRKTPWDVPSHYANGMKSDFKKNILTYHDPSKFQKIAKAKSGLAVWIFTGRSDPDRGMLRIDLMNGDKVLARGYWYECHGWQCLKIPYWSTGKEQITGFRILAPQHSRPYWGEEAPTCAAIDDINFDSQDINYNGRYIEDFERDTVPRTWSADAKGSLEVETDLYYSGKSCLAWNWNGTNATLTCRWPEALRTLAGNHCLAFWLYNEQPRKDWITVDFMKDGRVLFSSWYFLNYHGWHVMAAPYAKLGWNAKNPPDSIRITAPKSVAKGRLFFDFVNFNCIGFGAGWYRPATPAPDKQQPWINNLELLKTPEKCCFMQADPSQGRPWLPAPLPKEKITREQLEFLKKFQPKPLPPPAKPGKNKIPRKTIRNLYEIFEQLELRSSNITVNGRPISGRLNIPPDAVNTHSHFLRYLLGPIVDVHYQARRIGDVDAMTMTKKAILMLVRYYVDQGYTSMSDQYLILKPEDNLLDLLKDWNETDLYDALMEARQFFGSHGGDLYNEEPPGDSDMIGNYIDFIRLSCRMNPVLAVQSLQIAQRSINRICSRVNAQPFGPDGTFYHHGMHHWDYASYECPIIFWFIETFAGTPYQLDKQCYEICKKYTLSMAWSADKYTMPANLPARPGDIRTLNMADWASRLIKLSKYYGYDPVDKEMAALFLALTDKPNSPEAKQYRALGIEPYKFSGHRVMNGTATNIHRRDDWMFCVVGYTKHFRAYEIYGWHNNSYSMYFRNGSHYLVSKGDPASCQASGWSFEGWDNYHFPGATNPVGSPQALWRAYSMACNDSAFIGGTDLDGDGVWGSEYRAYNLRFNKSAFCFGRRITMLTSDIAWDKKKDLVTAPLTTTLYQNAFAGDAAVEPCFADGVEEKAFPSERTLQPGSAHWLIDNKGTGYYVHAGQSPLKVFRRPQTWTYMWSKYLKDKNNDPFVSADHIGKKRFRNSPIEANEKYYNPTQNNFAIAYFEHGEKPDATACGYTLLVRSNPKEMADFSEKMKSPDAAPYKILEQDAKAHIVWDRETNTTGYALFTGGEVTVEGPLRSVNRPSVAMVRKTGDRLKLSVVPPDWQETKPLILTVQGRWNIESTDGDKIAAIKAEVRGDTTQIEIAYNTDKPLTRYLPIHVTLKGP